MVKQERISKKCSVGCFQTLRGPVGGQKHSHFGGSSAGLCRRKRGPWCIAAMQRLSALCPVVHMRWLFPKRKIFSLKIKSFVSCRYACGLVGEAGFRRGYGYLLQRFCCMQIVAWQVQGWVVEPSVQCSGQAGSPRRELEL